MRFDALVLTQDEERHITACLESLKAARRIVVLDSGSTDGTVSLASSTPGVEVHSRPFASFADQRNFALDSFFTRGNWVLQLDADERLTPELATELADLQPPATAVAFNIASRTFLGGRPVLRASGYPVYQTRLTLAGAFHYEEVGHGQKAPASYGSLPRLTEPYDHHPFEKGYVAWRQRHLAYAAREARDIQARAHEPRLRQAFRDPIARRQWLKYATAHLPARPSLVWAHLMFLRGGILDGPAGWEYCRLRREYEGMVSKALASLQ